MDKDINLRIREYRKLKKMTQEELGKALGMKCSTYSQMERKGKITVDIAKAISEILGVDPDIIIHGEKQTPLDLAPIETNTLPLRDPTDNPYGKPYEPEIIISYKSGDFPLSVEETLLITQIRALESEDKQELIDFIDRRLKKKD